MSAVSRETWGPGAPFHPWRLPRAEELACLKEWGQGLDPTHPELFPGQMPGQSGHLWGRGPVLGVWVETSL